MNTICANPSDAMIVSFGFFWLAMLLSAVAGFISAWIGAREDRKRAKAATQILGRIVVYSRGWRLPDSLANDIRGFLGVP